MAFDKSQNLFVADEWSSVIAKFGKSGDGEKYAGTMSYRYTQGTFITVGNPYVPCVNSFADGPANEAMFDTPHDVVFDSAGNLYIADAENAAIRKITQSGTTATVTTLFLEAAPVRYDASATRGNGDTSGNTGSNSNSGGGGALSMWHLLALAALVAHRFAFRIVFNTKNGARRVG